MTEQTVIAMLAIAKKCDVEGATNHYDHLSDPSKQSSMTSAAYYRTNHLSLRPLTTHYYCFYCRGLDGRSCRSWLDFQLLTLAVGWVSVQFSLYTHKDQQ